MLAEAGGSIDRFFDSGVTELGDKLGPLLWQFAPTKKFDAEDFGAFLELLPGEDRRPRSAMWWRCATIASAPRFRRAAAQIQDAVVFAEHQTYPAIADITGDFVYARLQKGEDDIKTGYPPKALDAWAERAKLWAEGRRPNDLPRSTRSHTPKQPRDVFIYFIHEGKVRTPAAAMALIERLNNAKPKPLSTIGYEQATSRRARRTQARQGRACWSTCARSQPPAGPVSPSGNSPPGSTKRHRLSASAGARHAEGRPHAARSGDCKLAKSIERHLKTPR